MIAPKRILPSSTPPPQRPTPQSTKQRHVRRVSQACTSCRRQKMRCEGGDKPPCTRCRVSSTKCIFEKTPKPHLMDSSVYERLAEMEQEIEMIKATQRQMQTMLGEILNERRRGPGPPLQSASTESPTESSWNVGIVFPAAQTSPPGSMSEAPVTLATIAQTYLPSSSSHSGPQLSAVIAETPGDSPPLPTDPNQLSRKRKRVVSRVPGSADPHNNSSKRSRCESSHFNARPLYHHRVSHDDMSLPPPESKDQDVLDKETLSQPDTEQLFAMYAYLPPLWS